MLFRSISNFPNQDLQNIIKSYSDLKQLLSGISTAENPLDLLSALQAQNSIARLQDRLNPVQLIPTLKSIVKSVETLSKVVKNVAGFLNKINYVIKVLNTIIKILTALVKLIRNIPLPARWALVGVILKLEKTAKSSEDKLKQASEVLANAGYFVSTVATAFNKIGRAHV